LRKAGNPNSSTAEELPGPTEIGLTQKQVPEARVIRDAEAAEPADRRWRG